MTLKRHPIAVSSQRGALARLPLDRALIARLEATYLELRKHEGRLAEIFYAKLFAAAPQLRAMFRGDISAQSQKLMASLDAVVRNLADPESNAAMLQELGRKHAGYGVKPEHYALVSELLVDSMRELLGAAASAESLAEWRRALDLIGAQMQMAGDLPADHAGADRAPDRPGRTGSPKS